jgi:hypothetical protein
METRTSLLLGALVFFVLCSPAWAQWTEPVPVDEVNTNNDEWTPFLSYDGLTLYFARGRLGGTPDLRIYQATRDEPFGPFTAVSKIGSLTGNSDVWGPWVSPGNLRMYYSVDTGTTYRLKLSERPTVYDPWPNGTGISELNALGQYILTSCLTPDELIIVFVGYEVPGGQGDYDLWMATRPDTAAPFGNVTNLSLLNTAASEGGPFISPDGLALYFHSHRNGQWQLFKATRQSTEEPFGPPEHLSFFDTPGGHSAQPCLSSDGSAFYFRSHVTGAGHTDIHVSYLTRHPVAIDIKPGSCPNPLNLGSRGVLPVAILGSEELDVSEVDVASVQLAGVGPVRSSYEDVATPLADGSECDCTEEGGDGLTDLTLKFKTAEVAEELLNTFGDVSIGELLVLPLTASLIDGTPIEGEDCVQIVGKTPRALAAKKADVDGDGIINIYDFAVMANYWLEYAAVDY